MGCPTEVEIGDNLVFSVTTHDPDTGVLTDADSVPTYRVYEDETGTAILTGSMAKLDDANTTGFYSESIACTSGNGFENGKTYTVYIEATVDSDKGGICYGFKAYDQRKADAIQISGDSTAANNAELAFDGTGYGFTGCTMPTVTTLTGHTAQTGDNYARLGAPAGASIAADIAVIEAQTDDIGAAGAGLTAIPWNSAWDAEVQSECADALNAIDLDHLIQISAGAEEPTDGSYLDQIMHKDASQTFDATTDSLEAIRDTAPLGTAMRGTDNAALAATALSNATWTDARAGYLDNINGHTAQTGDNYARLGAPAGASIAADIAENQSDLNAIKAKTDNQPAGIPKNVALSNFEFLMVDSTDHITPKTGLTVSGEISKDGGAFASLTNSVTEISNGVYKVNITQTEMNADVITLKFTGTGADQRTITIKTST